MPYLITPFTSGESTNLFWNNVKIEDKGKTIQDVQSYPWLIGLILSKLHVGDVLEVKHGKERCYVKLSSLESKADKQNLAVVYAVDKSFVILRPKP